MTERTSMTLRVCVRSTLLAPALLLMAGSLAAQIPADEAVLSDVQAIMDDPRVRAAFDHLVETDEQTMADLRELTEIPAPPFMETERGIRFRERLEEIGV